MRDDEIKDDPLGLKMGLNIAKVIVFSIIGLALFCTLYFFFK